MRINPIEYFIQLIQHLKLFEYRRYIDVSKLPPPKEDWWNKDVSC